MIVNLKLNNEEVQYGIIELVVMTSSGSQICPSFSISIMTMDDLSNVSDIEVSIPQYDGYGFRGIVHTINRNYNVCTLEGIPLPRELSVVKYSRTYHSGTELLKATGLPITSELSKDIRFNISQIAMTNRKFISEALRGTEKDIVYAITPNQVIVRSLNSPDSDTDLDPISESDQFGIVGSVQCFRSPYRDVEIKSYTYQGLTVSTRGDKTLCYDSVNDEYYNNYLHNLDNLYDLDSRYYFNAKFNYMTGYELLDKVKVKLKLGITETKLVTSIITSFNQDGQISQIIKFN